MEERELRLRKELFLSVRLAFLLLNRNGVVRPRTAALCAAHLGWLSLGGRLETSAARAALPESLVDPVSSQLYVAGTQPSVVPSGGTFEASLGEGGK
jgi:hypothetical protein